jgi:nucleotide-binding universal stress UspA family protein
MPETPIVYEDVQVVDHDDLGLTCLIGVTRAFIGKYVPLDGTTVRRTGDRGRLALPRWFVEQQGLPLDRHLSDPEVDGWFARARAHAATAQKRAEKHPDDGDAQEALERAMAELAAAMVVRTRRQGPPVR